MSFLLRPSSRPSIPAATALSLASIALLCVVLPARAATSSDSQQSLAQLEERANQASPREQCFLYAQLVQQMTEMSISQYQAGNVSRATGLLQQIQQGFGRKIGGLGQLRPKPSAQHGQFPVRSRDSQARAQLFYRLGAQRTERCGKSH